MDVRRAMAREDPLFNYIARIDTAIPGLRRYKYPGADKDQLFRVTYAHSDPNASCRKCGCDLSQLVDRYAEESDEVGISLMNMSVWWYIEGRLPPVNWLLSMGR
jgi:hypothetical protein